MSSSGIRQGKACPSPMRFASSCQKVTMLRHSPGGSIACSLIPACIDGRSSQASPGST